MTDQQLERLAQRMVELWWAEHDKRERAKAAAYDRAFRNARFMGPPQAINAIGGVQTSPPRGVR